MLIKFLVLITFLYALFNSKNKLLLVILGLSLSNTLITSIFIYYKIPYYVNNKLYIIVHSILWLVVLYEECEKKRIVFSSILLYVLITFIDLLLIENYYSFKYKLVFVSGALLYLILFLIESFHQLLQENLVFFQKNNFILIFSPILFFIGYSFLFGFESRKLNDTIVIGHCTLFYIISNFVNIIYYSLLIYYIKKNKLNSNVKF